jgi:hypothetical protein
MEILLFAHKRYDLIVEHEVRVATGASPIHQATHAALLHPHTP